MSGYTVAAGVQVRSTSMPGRFLIFVQRPPTAMQVDAHAVLVLRLCEQAPDADTALREYADRLSRDVEAARPTFTRSVDDLVRSQVLVQTRDDVA